MNRLLSSRLRPRQALKEDFPLSHVISPFTNQERREGMLLNLLIPFVLTVGSGSKGKEKKILKKSIIGTSEFDYQKNIRD